jgi:hypothetical protein
MASFRGSRLKDGERNLYKRFVHRTKRCNEDDHEEQRRWKLKEIGPVQLLAIDFGPDRGGKELRRMLLTSTMIAILAVMLVSTMASPALAQSLYE